MKLKNLFDNPYLAPVMTPLKWVGQCTAFLLSPYTETYRAAKLNRKHPNPFLNYGLNLFDDKHANNGPVVMGAFLNAGSAGLGAFLGFGCAVGGGAAQVVAGMGLAGKIIAGLGIIGVSTVVGAVVAPLVVAAAAVVAAVAIPALVATVPGFLYGCKQTFDHVTGRAAAPAPTVPSAAPPLDEQLNAAISDMPVEQKKDVLLLLQGKLANGFPENGPTNLDKNITVSKAIRLKKPAPA